KEHGEQAHAAEPVEGGEMAGPRHRVARRHSRTPWRRTRSRPAGTARALTWGPRRRRSTGARSAPQGRRPSPPFRATPTPPVREVLAVLRARRLTELAERLRLDLPNALARHLEALADLFECVVRLLADPEAETQDLLLARRERREHLPGLLLERERHRGVGGR